MEHNSADKTDAYRSICIPSTTNIQRFTNRHVTNRNTNKNKSYFPHEYLIYDCFIWCNNKIKSTCMPRRAIPRLNILENVLTEKKTLDSKLPCCSSSFISFSLVDILHVFYIKPAFILYLGLSFLDDSIGLRSFIYKLHFIITMYVLSQNPPHVRQ